MLLDVKFCPEVFNTWSISPSDIFWMYKKSTLPGVSIVSNLHNYQKCTGKFIRVLSQGQNDYSVSNAAWFIPSSESVGGTIIRSYSHNLDISNRNLVCLFFCHWCTMYFVLLYGPCCLNWSLIDCIPLRSRHCSKSPGMEGAVNLPCPNRCKDELVMPCCCTRRSVCTTTATRRVTRKQAAER